MQWLRMIRESNGLLKDFKEPRKELTLKKNKHKLIIPWLGLT